MHKIRLYVVPEAQEDLQCSQEDSRSSVKKVVQIDDLDSSNSSDLPANIMHRRNSRRPIGGSSNGSSNSVGVLKLNVVQKDRIRSDSNMVPKLKQQIIKQQQLQILHSKNDRSSERCNNNDNKSINKQPHQIAIKYNVVANNDKKNGSLTKNDSFLPKKGNINNSVFSSPFIKEFAVNLEEKLIERQAKTRKLIRNGAIANDHLGQQINNGNNNIHGSYNQHHGILSPIFEVSSPDQSINKKNSCESNEDSIALQRHDKIQKIQLKIDGATIQQNSTPNNSINPSVILRKNNKLNRYREYDLEQKIEVEIKMREGSARLLAAARHRAQSLEAARALLTSNERMSAYMAELQRRKKEPSNKPSLPVSTARVSLSDLRVPLMWRDSDHFKNRGDYRRFAVFCLARVGTEIHDTALLCPVDRALTDVTFPDILVFNNVPADFEVTLEIYSHILQEDLSIASTPRRIKRSIHSSISRTVGKKLAASLRDELNSGKIGPHFELMASARLTLDDTEDNIHTHDLVLNNLENKSHSLPLFGHFCCRLAAQPECVTKEACSGHVVLDGRSCWARIQGFTLQAWDSRKLAEEDQNPWCNVPINRETLIQPSKSLSRELRISNTIDGTEKITIIKLDTADEAQKWVRQLVAHAKDHLRWKHAAETIQEVPSVESARNSFISNKRQGSLYDETPLIESVQSDYTATRPTVQEIFGLTPSTSLSSCSSTSSPPSLRSRSLSTSGSRKLGTNTLRSHWPFSNKSHD
ncbi:rhotekin-like isoform X1 [Athalia rosae]|uniref:rhotekin-like isoform X1 n=2 Tax=Athalia rosae TaxID=37344 RepID=UPI0020340D21|nr:rhotekin-like isoform X1 [Athalia rosae]